MGGKYSVAAALLPFLIGTMVEADTVPEQTSFGSAAAAAKPDQPLIVVSLLPADQRQASAVAPRAAQVLRCAAQQQQQPAPLTADSAATEVLATVPDVHQALSSAADTLQKAVAAGAVRQQLSI